MGHIYKILLLSITLLMFGCSDIYNNEKEAEDDREEVVKLLLSLDGNSPQSKSIENILTASEENKINTLQIMIFRNSGEERLMKNYYFSSWKGTEIIDSYTGRFRYVMIANAPQMTNVTKYSDISPQLYKITCEEDLVKNKSLVALFDKKLVVPYPPTEGAVVELKDGTDNIKLVRLSAKIQFSIIIDDITLPDNLGKLRDRLRFRSIEVKKVSDNMYMFKPNSPIDQNTSSAIDYPLRTIPTTADRSQPIYENYYIPERIAGSSMTEGTYAEIIAEYSDIDNSNPTKLITYRVKINTNPVTNNQYTGLFNVVRNSAYQMNIRIQGVNPDDIHVDVEDIHNGFVFVNDNATGRKTGATWEDAFNTINEALAFSKSYNAKPTNTNKIKLVYVKEGTYKEKIEMVNNVSVLGGFSEALKEKDITQNYTIKPILDGAGLQTPLITFGSELSLPTMLAYFNIQNAQGTMTDGAALYMNSTQAIVQSCLFYGNSGRNGGAAFIRNGQIWSSIFLNNTASGYGSAVYADQAGSMAKIMNATFVNNSPSGNSVVYAANHPNAELINSIIQNQGSTDCTPQGWTFKNCAFTKETLMPWELIAAGNLRICSPSAPHIYPYAAKITDAGFIPGSQSYELSSTSDLIVRGYLPLGDYAKDFNGKIPYNPKSPDLGANQTGINKPYLDLYFKQMEGIKYVPSINDVVNAVVFTNSDNFWLDSKVMSSVENPLPKFKEFPVFVDQANPTQNDIIRTGIMATGIQNVQRSFAISQAYMNFALNPDLLSKTRIMIGPDAATTMSEFLWENDIYLTVTSSLPESDRTFLKVSNIDWLGATSKNSTIYLNNGDFILPVSQKETHSNDIAGLKASYNFMKPTETKPISGELNIKDSGVKSIQITQLPEWHLCSNPTITVLGGEITDYQTVAGVSTGAKAFVNWKQEVLAPGYSSEVDGKTNTLEAVNLLIQNGIFKDMNEKVENAFIFCASLNKTAKAKISSSQPLSRGDLEWYVPSINQLKMMMIFENNALGINAQKYYFSSTFKQNKLVNILPFSYQYQQSVITASDFTVTALTRCIRDKKPVLSNLEMLGSVKIESTIDGYKVNSSDYYSSSIVSVPSLPDYTQMAKTFEIYKENSTEMTLEQAKAYCSSLPSTNGVWRLPSQKEIGLMAIYQDEFKSKSNFTPISKDLKYFFNGATISGAILVQNFLTGAVDRAILSTTGYTRCVRSVQ